MNVKTVVASDNFGDIAEGNVGEFLKFMPGVTLDYVETDTRAARLSGMEARYGYVTLDGNTMANTVAGSSFGADARQFEFEAFSIRSPTAARRHLCEHLHLRRTHRQLVDLAVARVLGLFPL